MSKQASRAMLRGQVVPTLPARDIDETVAYYRGLGFELVAIYPGEQRYAIVRRDDAELHFYEFPVDPKDNLSGCYLRIDDARAVHDEWDAAGIEILQPLTETDYGLREFAVSDPNGKPAQGGKPPVASGASAGDGYQVFEPRGVLEGALPMIAPTRQARARLARGKSL